MRLYAAGLMLIAQAGVAVGLPEQAFWERILTQGGLFAVCVILIYMNQLLQKQMNVKDEQKMSVLTDLVASTQVTLTKIESSNQQLLRTLDTFEQRRTARH